MASQIYTGNAQAELNNACYKIASAPVGVRNSTLNGNAFWLGRLIWQGELDREAVRKRLTQAAVDCGLELDEIRRTLVSALDLPGAAYWKCAEPRLANLGIVKLLFTDADIMQSNHFLDVARRWWNQLRQANQDNYAATLQQEGIGRFLTLEAMRVLLEKYKTYSAWSDLRTVPRGALRQVCWDMDQALTAKPGQPSRFPHFYADGDFPLGYIAESVYLTKADEDVYVGDGRIKLPKLSEAVRFEIVQPLPQGRITSARIKKLSGSWVAILHHVSDTNPPTAA